MNFSEDAFSSGQIGSKIWLCKHLERHLPAQHSFSGRGYVIWVYGGWVGLLPFLLSCREKLRIQRIVNFDENTESLHASEKVNDLWHWKGSYRGLPVKSSDLNYQQLASIYDEPEPHVVINTAPELMSDDTWFKTIPDKKMVLIQSSNMALTNSKPYHSSLEELKKEFPVSNLIYIDKMHFDYQNDASFSRYMLIGFK